MHIAIPCLAALAGAALGLRLTFWPFSLTTPLVVAVVTSVEFASGAPWRAIALSVVLAVVASQVGLSAGGLASLPVAIASASCCRGRTRVVLSARRIRGLSPHAPPPIDRPGCRDQLRSGRQPRRISGELREVPLSRRRGAHQRSLWLGLHARHHAAAKNCMRDDATHALSSIRPMIWHPACRIGLRRNTSRVCIRLGSVNGSRASGRVS